MHARHTLGALTALALGAAPALAQEGHQHQPATDAAQPHAMVCTMGMLPHAGMGGMMHGQGMMQHGEKRQMQPAQQGQMQHGEAHGQMQSEKKAGEMKHGGMMQGGMMQGGMMQGGMMQGGMMHPVTPTMLVHHASEIGLTEDQVTRLTAMATAAANDCQGHMKAAMDAHKAAFQVLGSPASTPDLANYEARLRDATTHMLQGHMAVVRAGQEARALLTPAQLEKLGQHRPMKEGAHSGH